MDCFLGIRMEWALDLDGDCSEKIEVSVVSLIRYFYSCWATLRLEK